MPEVGRDRPRARRAYAVLRRGQARRTVFVSAYGQASTPTERLTAAFAAVRATLPKTRAVPLEVARCVDRIADDLADLFIELHTAQEAAAQKVVRTKQRQAARNQVRADQRRAAETAALDTGGER
ncbi:hypothetical protein [Pseudonocardia sp. Ae505_Ps2]|uniref:hypothetical protein n=1 Tax=Pseudonocardia sp. Ae505_Ps2 TaxID=1885034 RepID=UPI0009666D7A|nr:hypothetical protein [Pseudonocardia sp. Ae505_Ps2]OLM08453.1 hypothetical protein Ae505Ps2_6159 [Pseudonocardia sp. Ae505_Ps2]